MLCLIPIYREPLEPGTAYYLIIADSEENQYNPHMYWAP